jgi:hypothetical protein
MRRPAQKRRDGLQRAAYSSRFISLATLRMRASSSRMMARQLPSFTFTACAKALSSAYLLDFDSPRPVVARRAQLHPRVRGSLVFGGKRGWCGKSEKEEDQREGDCSLHVHPFLLRRKLYISEKRKATRIH